MRRTSSSRPRRSNSSARCSPEADEQPATPAEALLAEARDVGDPLLEAVILRTQGWAHLVEGEFEEAERVADECLRISEEVGSRYETALALIMRGQVKEATGRDRTEDHARARAILTDLGVVSLPRRATVSA